MGVLRVENADSMMGLGNNPVRIYRLPNRETVCYIAEKDQKPLFMFPSPVSSEEIDQVRSMIVPVKR